MSKMTTILETMKKPNTTPDTTGDTGATFAPSWRWITAGKAVFTVHNADGKHYTYRVTRSEPTFRYPEPTMFVSLLTGPNNNQDYTYLGILKENGYLTLTGKSAMPVDATPVKVAAWALKRVRDGKDFPEGYGILASGTCGRCGRKLSVPASLYDGFGPECIKHV